MAKKPPRKKTGGRTTKCTEAVTAAIETCVREGMGHESAARKAGIGVATFWRWMHDGAKDDGAPVYREFRRRIQAASDRLEEEIASVHMLALRHSDIRVAAPQARWMGERLFPG